MTGLMHLTPSILMPILETWNIQISEYLRQIEASENESRDEASYSWLWQEEDQLLSLDLLQFLHNWTPFDREDGTHSVRVLSLHL